MTAACRRGGPQLGVTDNDTARSIRLPMGADERGRDVREGRRWEPRLERGASASCLALSAAGRRLAATIAIQASMHSSPISATGPASGPCTAYWLFTAERATQHLPRV